LRSHRSRGSAAVRRYDRSDGAIFELAMSAGIKATRLSCLRKSEEDYLDCRNKDA
jgi:hypothetical protein